MQMNAHLYRRAVYYVNNDAGCDFVALVLMCSYVSKMPTSMFNKLNRYYRYESTTKGSYIDLHIN